MISFYIVLYTPSPFGDGDGDGTYRSVGVIGIHDNDVATRFLPDLEAEKVVDGMSAYRSWKEWIAHHLMEGNLELEISKLPVKNYTFCRLDRVELDQIVTSENLSEIVDDLYLLSLVGRYDM